MTPDEQLEFRANHNVVTEVEEFPYCLSCGSFGYLDEKGACMRCHRKQIIWRQLPFYEPETKGIERLTLLFMGLLALGVAGFLAWVAFK